MLITDRSGLAWEPCTGLLQVGVIRSLPEGKLGQVRDEAKMGQGLEGNTSSQSEGRLRLVGLAVSLLH